jgi:gliding motility-associated-like protein
MRKTLLLSITLTLGILWPRLCTAQLAADFTASVTSGCTPLVVSFTDATTGGTPTSWLWSLGNGSNPTSQHPSTTYTTPGVYTVTLTAFSASGSDAETKTGYITVYGPPAISFTANKTSGCLPLSVQFNSNITANGSGDTTYTWDFGDGTSNSNAPNPSHTFTSAGTFNVTLTVQNGPCLASFTRSAYITVYALPVPTFTTSQTTFCAIPATALFTNTSSGFGPLSATWTFGDGGTGSGNLATNTYNTSGVFNVSLTTTDGHGCSATVNAPAHISVYGTPASFTSAASGCTNDSVQFINTAGGTGILWDFGDGNTDTLPNPKHLYGVPGTYAVKLTLSIGPCTKSISRSITINAPPPSAFSYSPIYPCPPPSLLTFTGAGSPSLSYQWDFGNSATGSGKTATHTYNTTGWKSVTLNVTDPATGCMSSTSIDTVAINQLYGIITPSPVTGCIPLTAALDVFLFGTCHPDGPDALYPPPDPPYPVQDITWNYYYIGGGSISFSTLENPIVTWYSRGVDSFKATGMAANGCVYEARGGIARDTPSHASFTLSDSVVCPNALIQFTNLTKNPAITKLTWIPGDGSNPVDTVWSPGFVYKYKKPGIYHINLSADHNGCKDSMVRSVRVKPSDALFGFVRNCGTSYTVRFTDSSTGATSWYWDFGDGTSSSIQHPTHSFPAAGTYNVALTTYNNIENCGGTFLKPVTVAPVSLAFHSNQTTICKGDNALLIASYSGATPGILAWTFSGDTLTRYTSDTVLQKTFLDTGYHDVMLVAISGDEFNCYDTVFKPSYIYVTQPHAKFTSSSIIGCSPLTVTFKDSSTSTFGANQLTRVWNYGNKTLVPTALTTTTHTYLRQSRDTAILYISDPIGCRDSMKQIIDVRRPKAGFTIPKATICANEALPFTDTSSGIGRLSYRWDFGDGTRDTVRNPLHKWTAPGTYSVRLIVTDTLPCADTATRTAYITVQSPTADFSMDDTVAICPPLVVHFINNSIGAASYSWDLGTGSSPISVINPLTTYTKPGKYMVVLTAIDAKGCTNTDTGYTYVLGYNGAFIFTPVDACLFEPVTFSSPVPGIPKITWDFDDGNILVTNNISSVTHTYTNTGSYRPKAIFSDGANCNAVDSGTVPIRIDKVDAKFNTSVPCVGAPFTLSDASTALFSSPSSWRWLFTPSDTAVGNNPSYTFSTPGPHPVRLIVTTNWGCKDTLTKDVFINDLPKVDAGPADTGICPGDTILLTGRGAIDYTWGPDSLVSCINCPATWVRKAEPPTTYYVKGIDANGCINYDSIRARIQIQTTSQIMPGGDICIGDTFRLFAYGANYYSWEPVEFLDSAFINSPLATPIITTTYVVTAKEGTCLERKDSVTVVVHPLPIFDAGPEEWINFGSSITLQPTEKNISRIEWRQDSTLSCLDCFHPVAKPSFTTIYYATAYSDFGCKATDSVLVKVRCNGDSIYIPNTFTPNGDGQNDVFYPRGKGVTFMSNLRIYNRWGEMVFERSEQFPLNVESMGWDGTYKGRQLPPDVYVYTMSTRCPTGEPLNFKGDLTLVR